MRQSVGARVAVTMALALVGGCGMTVRPHLGSGNTVEPAGVAPRASVSPRPAPSIGLPDETRPVIDQVCRAQTTRSGWIAISYLTGGDNCPVSTDPDNPYTAAVIERYSDKPVDATMVVCADQTIPLNWVREYNRDVRATCDGARVKQGEPTVMVIRRVSKGS